MPALLRRRCCCIRDIDPPPPGTCTNCAMAYSINTTVQGKRPNGWPPDWPWCLGPEFGGPIVLPNDGLAGGGNMNCVWKADVIQGECYALDENQLPPITQYLRGYVGILANTLEIRLDWNGSLFGFYDGLELCYCAAAFTVQYFEAVGEDFCPGGTYTIPETPTHTAGVVTITPA